MAKCSRENRRGADRQITVVVCGWIRLAPTGNPALPRRFRRRQDRSKYQVKIILRIIKDKIFKNSKPKII